MIASFTLLHPLELEALPRDLTLFLFPLGGLEQHGPHLGFGVKLVVAEEMAKRIAEGLSSRLQGWNFVLMPVLPLSVDTNTSRLALPVRAHVVRDAIVDQCEQLKRLGFRNFVSVSSHLTPRQLTALEDAARMVSSAWWSSRPAQMVSVSGALVPGSELWNSPLVALPSEHGGAMDSGLMLKLRPDLVSASRNELVPLPKPKASPMRLFSHLRNELDGYWGDPASAQAEVSHQGFQSDVDGLVARLLPWLERSEGKKQFLSPYGRFPMNGSFFKAYLLASLFFVLMTVWALWSMRDVFEP